MGTQAARSSQPGALPPMTEAEFRTLYGQLRDRLPWGAADRRGELNNRSTARNVSRSASVPAISCSSGSGMPQAE